MKDRVLAWIALNGPTLGVFALLLVLAMLLAGCNTIAGMGSDIQKSANWTAEKMSGNKSDPPKSN